MSEAAQTTIPDLTLVMKPEPNLALNPDWHNKTVTILGKSRTGEQCKFDTDEIWGVNNVCEHPEHQGKKIHKTFAFDVLPPEYIAGIKKFAPVCSWQDYADIPYPLDDIIHAYGSTYFTNTISYMIALAGYLKVKQLKIYGVDLTFGAAYAQENRGLEYWIGRVQERGVEVYMPPDSQLLRTISGSMYGVRDQCNAMMFIRERIALLNLLPQRGTYPDIIKAQNARWVLFPKSDEATAHGLKVMQTPQGLSFQVGEQGDWQSDVHMPPQSWDYIRKLLIDLEKAGQLPAECIEQYEKMVLSQPVEHN